MAIKHKRVVVSEDKGMAEDWNDDHEIDDDVDQDQNQFLNAVIENRTDWPAGPVEGQIIYRTDLNRLYVYDGASWQETVMNPLEEDLDADANQIKNQALPTDDGDSVTLEYYTDTLTGVSSWAKKDSVQNWSAGGFEFIPKEAGSDAFYVEADGSGPLADVSLGTATVEVAQESTTFYCPVHLPQGCVVRSAAVYGAAAGETWTLKRVGIVDPTLSDDIASDNFDAQTNTIANGTVANNAWFYVFVTSSLDNGDQIHGARISYYMP